MKSQTLPVFLRYFAPLAALLLLCAVFYAYSHRDTERSRLEASELLSVHLGAGLLERRLTVISRDLSALSKISAVRELIEDSSAAMPRQRLEQDFLGFLEAHQAYDQARLLDLDGQERVRVDFNNGSPRVVDRKALQNKADRYYFKESVGLPPGSFYISPVDLNIEHGQIERPYKPMLRVATPLADSRGNKLGVLVLNYLFAETTGYFKEVTRSAADHLMIVNNDGYFLHAPDPADEWGFMFDRPELSLAHRFPASWAKLAATGESQFEDEHGLWTLATVHPLQAAPKNLADSPSAQQWKVVSHIPPSALPSLFSGLGGLFYMAIASLLLLAAGTAYYLASSRQRQQLLEKRFRLYFENAIVGMAVNDDDKRWQLVNPALCKMLGYPAEQLSGMTWLEITHPEDIPESIAAYERITSGDSNGFDLEKRYIRADGTIIHAHVSVQAMRKADGSIDSLLVMLEDISSRLTAEKALRSSEERLRSLGDNLPDAYVFQCSKGSDGQLEFTYISSGAQQIHGHPPEAILRDAKLILGQIDPGQVEALQQATAASERTLDDFMFEAHVRGSNDCWRWLQLRSRPHRSATGKTVWDGIAIDVTARREAAQLIDLQARRAEAQLELPRRSGELDETAFLQLAIDRIESLTDSRIGFIHFINDDELSIEMLAWSSNTSDGYCLAPDDRHHAVDKAGLWAEAARRKQPVIINDYATAEDKHGLPEGHSPLERLISIPVIDDGRVRVVAGVGNKATPYTETDVETVLLLATEAWRIARQRRAEQALMIALQVVNASPVICFRWRVAAGRPLVFVSDNVARWGYSVDSLLAGKPCFAEMLHPDDQARVIAEIERHTAEGLSNYTQEYRLLTAAREVIWVFDRTNIVRDVAGTAVFYDGVLTDISERRRQAEELTETLAAQRQLNKRLEEANNQLLQSEKMASIGQLAAGVAHELNNPIGFVHSNLGTLEGYLRDIMEILEAYDQALAAGDDPAGAQARIALMKEERDFAYIRDDIVQLLGESKDGLARVRKIVQDLKSFSHVSEQEWQWADLHQGLDSTLNIVWNELKYKCQVIKEYGELPKVYCLISQLNQVFMNLLVNAGHAIESKGTIAIRTRRHGDDAVCIEVADTGKGIAPQHLSRIFEPFFTTKPVGKGTGLGLSLSYGIVNSHHGRIEVDSQEGVGTTFRIILPIQSTPGENAGASPETAQ